MAERRMRLSLPFSRYFRERNRLPSKHAFNSPAQRSTFARRLTIVPPHDVKGGATGQQAASLEGPATAFCQ